MSGVPSERLILAEINGAKYVKIISANKKNKDMKLMNIGLRSSRIFAYEMLETKEFENRMIKEPKFDPKDQTINKHKFFKSIQDLKTFDTVDAQDYRGDWYRGIVMGKKTTKQDDVSMKVHFIEYEEKWDEFYDDDNLYKVAPPGTYAQEPASKDYTFIAYHRVNQYVFEGIPFVLTLSSEMTWNEAYIEIMTQVSRSIKKKYYKELKVGAKLNNKTFRLDMLDDIIENPPFNIIFVESTGKKCLF